MLRRKSNILVMKFGGTSVETPDKIRHAAERVVHARRGGRRIVVVVSAPGRMTDDLISLAKQIVPQPDQRELDMLLATGEQVGIALLTMAIKAKNVDAISLTGPQAGIAADDRHTRAHITGIRPNKLLQELKKGRVVIVAGFQGLNPREDIATLGRGGSDLTAVALAAVLKAERCDIFTDVRGIYTADPSLVPEARLLSHISYDEMLELASAGAQVMQPRSIEIAKKFSVPIRVSHALNPKDLGSWITAQGQEKHSMEEAVVTGVALDRNQIKVTLRDIPDRPGMAAELFSALGQAHINVDMIIQSAAKGNINDISFTISKEDLGPSQKILASVQRELRAGSVETDARVAKISIVGVGMKKHSGVAGKMFKVLADHRINIQMIATSEIKISCIIASDQGKNALKLLHQAFGLHRASLNSSV
ncbi:MAG: aspartate kinase [Elusimicrobia bacterium]|nr:aspartate kinase [Elusimicrobiota bacterium]